MKPFLLILFIVFTMSCNLRSDSIESTDQAKLQGVWLGQKESLNGITKDVNFQYIFKEDTITFIDETGKEMKYSFQPDTTSYPRLLILRATDTLADPTPVGVGYELIGDSLNIIVAPPGLQPKDVSDKYNQELISCRRKGS